MNQIEINIQEKLHQIEKTEHVRILHCVESGSRSWGFASPDSDYDVRFIYIRQTKDYLRLNPVRDVIEFQLDDIYDINGWDVQKLLRLLYKSNPTVFEWASSPIVYQTNPDWNKIIEILPEYFDQKAILHHYLSMAYHNKKAYLEREQIQLKKYFYVLRPILAANWVLHKNTPSPMLFSELVQEELPSELMPEIQDLLEQKKSMPEIGTGQHIKNIDLYISDQLAALKQAITTIKSERKSWENLDIVFQKLLLS